MRGSLQQRIWLTSLVTVGVGLLIAFFAIRAVGRLDARVREQHRHEVEQKRELARLSSKLLQAQEDERRRIARELHDEIGQSLGALKLELAVAERIMPEVSIDEVLAEARSITDRTLQTVRDLSQLLHPAMLDDLGLPDTADWYLRAFSRRTGIASELSIDRLEERLAPEVEMCTYRVIQEAVTQRRQALRGDVVPCADRARARRAPHRRRGQRQGLPAGDAARRRCTRARAHRCPGTGRQPRRAFARRKWRGHGHATHGRIAVVRLVMTPLRILVADDHTLVRQGLRKILESQPGWVVVGEAGDGRDAVQQTMDLQPDVVIMDIAMPRLNGVEARAANRAPAIRTPASSCSACTRTRPT